MQSDDLPPPLHWPELPDEAAVTLHACLNDFLILFESHYYGQIHRYYRERSHEALMQPDLFRSADPDAPPF